MTNIPVVFCFDSRIILGASVAIKSLIDCAKNTTTYDIRILHSDINLKDQMNISKLAENTRHNIAFHYINPDIFKNTPKNKGSWTEIVYYRLLIPEILKEYDKVIYSDVDVLFRGDLEEVFNTNLDNYEAAAVPTCTVECLKELQPERYFKENKNKLNFVSGFIIFNNKKASEENLVKKIFETIKIFNKRLIYFDMDVFNLTYTKIKELPLNYCAFETLYEYTNIKDIPEYKKLKTMYSDEELIIAKNNPTIIHYAGKLGKPWQRKWVPDIYQEYIDRLPKNLIKYTLRDIRKKYFTKNKYPKQFYDVGIVNFYFTQNYGACLTAYALQEIIKSFGLKPAFVNEFNIKNKYKTSFSKKFANRFLKLMPKFNSLKEAGKRAKNFISGSDQVLRPKYLSKKNYADIFLLKFTNKNVKKIALSASFGIDNLEQEKKYKKTINKIKKELKGFDFVSSRELSGVEICKNNFEIYAEQVLDPVFLADKNIFIKLAKNSSYIDCKDKIVSYILDKNKILDDCLNGLQLKNKKKIINLANSGVSVETWLKCFIEAKYIITDSYHGVCFAILFNKPFLALSNNKRGKTRFETLKQLIDKELPIFEEASELIKNDFQNLNWEKINNKIAELKKEALNTLEYELKTKRKNFITDNCSGCSACYNVCPNNAITMKENFEGFLYPVVDSALCTNCNLCKKTCPNNICNNKNKKTPTCYAVMANNEVRYTSSSGGASYVMMDNFIKNGGYIVGAVYDEEWKIVHKISDNEKDLDSFKGSKYYQSNTLNVYQEIKKLLNEDKKVLFVGTPCQVAGLNCYLKKDYKNLIVVDIVCHGVPSYKVFKKFLDTIVDKNEKILSINFRSKKQGWSSELLFSLKTNSNEYYIESSKNSFMRAFLKNFSLRKSCFSCKFQKIPRQGDITIGDFWKIQKFEKKLDDKKGTSLLLINNKKGEEFFEKIKSELILIKKVPIKYAIKGNKTLVKPTKYNKKRESYMLNIDKNLELKGDINE